MKKKLLLVFPGTVASKKEHVQRLLDKYHVLAVAPDVMTPWVVELIGSENYLTVPFPYTELSIRDGVLTVNRWEEEHGSVDGIMPLSDTAMEYTAALMEKLNEARCDNKLRGISLKTAQIVRNKYEFRKLVSPFCKHIRSVSLKSPVDIEHARVGISFPAILKPAKGMGSMCVCRIDSFDSLQTSIHDSFHNLYRSRMSDDIKQQGFVLEEFFDGDEVDIDGWACDGSVGFSMVNDNVPTGPPDFRERGVHYPSQLSRAKIEVLKQLIEDVVKALGDMRGAFHFEARVNEDLEVIAIEMNARPGGAEVAYAVEATTGYHLHTVHAQLVLGEQVTRHSEVRYKAVATNSLYLDTECDLLGIRHIDSDKVKDLDVVIVRYLEQPRHVVPNRGADSCVCWMAVGGRDITDAKQKLRILESLIEYKCKNFVHTIKPPGP